MTDEWPKEQTDYAPRTQVTVGTVSFMRDHLNGRDWKTLKWTRQPDSFLCRISNKMESERSERMQGDIFQMGFLQGYFPVLNWCIRCHTCPINLMRLFGLLPLNMLWPSGITCPSPRLDFLPMNSSLVPRCHTTAFFWMPVSGVVLGPCCADVASSHGSDLQVVQEE